MPAILFERDAAPGTPEYDAENNLDKMLTFLGVTGGLALLSVVLRIYVRQFMLRFTGPDDIVMIVAMLFGIATYICFAGEGYHGLGRHMSVITPQDLSTLSHWAFYHNLFILAGICLAKISICLLLIRLVRHRGYVYFLWALLIFLAAYHIACELVIIFACVPIAAAWDFTQRPQAICISMQTFMVLGAVNSGINIFTDVLLAVLPIPVIMAMQLNKRTKFALSFVMMLGFIAVGAGAVKLKAQLTYLQDEDRLYRNRYPIWAAIELYFGILAASLPTLKPLVAKFMNSARSTIEDTSASRRNATRRNTKHTDDLIKGHLKSGTFYSECSTAIATPSPEQHHPGGINKDVGSYFSFFRGRQPSADLRTECSRHASINLDTLAVRAQPHTQQPQQHQQQQRHRDVSPAPSASSDAKNAYIVRTTKVSTTSEARSGGAVTPPPPTHRGATTGKRRSVSVSGIDCGAPLERKEVWAEIQPLHVRKVSSPRAGLALRRAMESEEELPMGDGESVESLVGGRVSRLGFR